MTPDSSPHTPLISVVTAAFNALEGLRRTVESVAGQDFRSVEHVVVDGGSVDGTREYLESLGDTVRWISEPDDGIADALNKGIAMARGEYVLVLQAEDTFVDGGSLGRAATHLANSQDIVAFEVLLDHGNGSGDRLKTRKLSVLTECKMTNPHQGLFCRRNLYQRIGVFDRTYRIAMDYEFLLRARRQGAKLHPVREILVIMPATGVSTQKDWQSIRRRLMEDRRLHRKHARGGLFSVLVEIFWLAYMPFKKLKTALSRG